jgi:hypothetical protein
VGIDASGNRLRADPTAVKIFKAPANKVRGE